MTPTVPPWRPAAASNLFDLVARRAARDPEGVYLTVYGRPLTAARLCATSLRYAGALAARGLGSGDKVALVLPTCEEFFFALFGTLALGAVPVPLYPTLGPELTGRVLRDSEARAVVTIDWFRDSVEAAKAEAPDLAHYLTPDLLEAEPALDAHARPSEDDVCLLQYTSGSTAAPRGVMLSHGNVMATVRMNGRDGQE